MRANLLFTYKGANKEKLLASAPVDLDFELFIISCAINLVRGMLNTKFATTMEKDRELLEKGNIENYRIKLAIIHRLN